MGAYTGTQLMTRLLALALGIAGGLSQTVWSHVIGLRCGAVQIGEHVRYTDCLPWTELFLRFPEGHYSTMGSLTLAAAIAGMVAGVAGMWRPRWAAPLFLLVAALNLGLIAYAMLTTPQQEIALGLSLLSIAAPGFCGLLLWWRGEYRVSRQRPDVVSNAGRG